MGRIASPFFFLSVQPKLMQCFPHAMMMMMMLTHTQPVGWCNSRMVSAELLPSRGSPAHTPTAITLSSGLTLSLSWRLVSASSSTSALTSSFEFLPGPPAHFQCDVIHELIRCPRILLCSSPRSTHREPLMGRSTSLSFDHWPLTTHQPSISALGIWLITFLSHFLDPLTSPTSNVSHQCPKLDVLILVHCPGGATASLCPLGCHEHEQMGLVMTDPFWGCLLGACEGWFLCLLEENSALALFPFSEARHGLSSPTANSLVTAPAIPLMHFWNAPNPASWKIPALPGTSCSCPVLALTLSQGS